MKFKSYGVDVIFSESAPKERSAPLDWFEDRSRETRVQPPSRTLRAVLCTAALGALACRTESPTGGSGVATQLAFSVQPASGPAGQLAEFRVEIRDADGQLVTSATNAVSVTINAAVGMAGQGTVNAVGGVATFSGLFILTPGTGYTLTASSLLLTSAVSAPFNIQAALNTTRWASRRG
jgi:hypothetical protein